ncbi:MAG: TlpA family protein disulfide reductase [Bacteroidales bacterium]|nr:TlpA family protein disulfide reductase [Bacteroidales bacterium]MBN2697866.1 TlpA family protein disulfide reductase [Bacteroidales bacterium]
MTKAFLTILSVLMLQVMLSGQTVALTDKDGLVDILLAESDTTYVVNFWATWCAPCIQEIGYFQELHNHYVNQKVKVILVSLDFPSQLKQRLTPFLDENNITADVRLMTDLDYNSWINLVDPGWSGAIPATLVFNNRKRTFVEKALSKNELFDIVKQNHY